MNCKYCNEVHTITELCKLTRRKFFFMFGIATAGLLIAPNIVIAQPKIEVLSAAQIFAMELDKMVPNLKTLFERDDVFYSMLKSRSK